MWFATAELRQTAPRRQALPVQSVDWLLRELQLRGAHEKNGAPRPVVLIIGGGVQEDTKKKTERVCEEHVVCLGSSKTKQNQPRRPSYTSTSKQTRRPLTLVRRCHFGFLVHDILEIGTYSSTKLQYSLIVSHTCTKSAFVTPCCLH